MRESCGGSKSSSAESGLFYLSNCGMNRVVNGIEQLGDLVDAEERINVVDKRNDDFGGSEFAPFERGIARIGKLGASQSA